MLSLVEDVYFLSEAKNPGAKGKEILTKVFPIVDKAYKENKNNIKKCISNYITSRYEPLYAPTPYDRLAFNDFDNFWKAIKLNEKYIEAQMNNAYFMSIDNFNPRSAKSPFVAAMISCIRSALKENDSKSSEILAIYLAFSGQFYPSIHAGSWKYLPNKEVLEYVVNNKLSNKYDLKKVGNVFGAIRNICITWLSTYKSRITSSDFDDEMYTIVVQQLHDRIKSFIKNIAKLYYDNKDNYFNYARDNMDPEDYHLRDTNSTLAEKYTSMAVTYMTTRDVNYKFCGMVADENVKKDEIKSIMSSIFHNKDNIEDLRLIVNIIITSFMREYPDEPIHSAKFLTFSMAAKPNTKDKDLIKVRETIVKWLNENSVDYVRRKSRQPTATSYYKCVLKMICLCINDAIK